MGLPIRRGHPHQAGAPGDHRPELGRGRGRAARQAEQQLFEPRRPPRRARHPARRARDHFHGVRPPVEGALPPPLPLLAPTAGHNHVFVLSSVWACVGPPEGAADGARPRALEAAAAVPRVRVARAPVRPNATRLAERRSTQARNPGAGRARCGHAGALVCARAALCGYPPPPAARLG